MTEEPAPHGIPLPYADSPEALTACLKRLCTAAACRTHEELAAFLGVRPAIISDARRRGSIPAQWLLLLLCKKWVNPAWILTGRGPFYVQPEDYALPNTPQRVLRNLPLPESVSTEALLAELARRTLRELGDTDGGRCPYVHMPNYHVE